MDIKSVLIPPLILRDPALPSADPPLAYEALYWTLGWEKGAGYLYLE